MSTRISPSNYYSGAPKAAVDDLLTQSAILRVQGKVADAYKCTTDIPSERDRIKSQLECIKPFAKSGNDRKALEAIEKIKETSLPERDALINEAKANYVLAKLSTYISKVQSGDEHSTSESITTDQLDEARSLLELVRGGPKEDTCTIAFTQLLTMSGRGRESLAILREKERTTKVVVELLATYLSIYERPDKPLKELTEELFAAFDSLFPSTRVESPAKEIHSLQHFAYASMARISFVRNDLIRGLKAFFKLPSDEIRASHRDHLALIIYEITVSTCSNRAELFLQLDALNSAARFPLKDEREKSHLDFMIQSGYQAIAQQLAMHDRRKDARAVLRNITFAEKREAPIIEIANSWIRQKYFEDAANQITPEKIPSFLNRQQLRKKLCIAMTLSNLQHRQYLHLLSSYIDPSSETIKERAANFFTISPLSSTAAQNAMKVIGKIRDNLVQLSAFNSLIEILFLQKSYRLCYSALEEMLREKRDFPEESASIAEKFDEIMRFALDPSQKTDAALTQFTIDSQKLFL